MKRMLCALLALLLASAAALAAEADDSPRPGDVFRVEHCEAYISLRTGPDAACDVLMRLRRGQELRYLGGVSGDFARVACVGAEGYVLWKYLEPAGGQTGAPVEPGDGERYNINLFLSNFSEQEFGYYHPDMPDADAARTDFYFDHVWYNRQDEVEWGEWGEANARIHDGDLAEVTRRYFGAVPASVRSRYTYAPPWFYSLETGGRDDGGFVCLDSVEALGGGHYMVRFHRYGMDAGWERADCGMTPAAAERAYPLPWDGERPEGFAILRAERLSDRDGFSLEEWSG